MSGFFGAVKLDLSDGLILTSVTAQKMDWALKWPTYQYIELYIDGKLVYIDVEGSASTKAVAFVSKRESIKQSIVLYAERHRFFRALEEDVKEVDALSSIFKLTNIQGKGHVMICRTGIGFDDAIVKRWVENRLADLTEVPGVFENERFV